MYLSIFSSPHTARGTEERITDEKSFGGHDLCTGACVLPVRHLVDRHSESGANSFGPQPVPPWVPGYSAHGHLDVHKHTSTAFYRYLCSLSGAQLDR